MPDLVHSYLKMPYYHVAYLHNGPLHHPASNHKIQHATEVVEFNMTHLKIETNDGVNLVSPLCEGQLNPTKLKSCHPDKHLPADIPSKQPYSLFLNMAQRNLFIELIEKSSVIKEILFPKVQSYGGDIRVFLDININALFPKNKEQYFFYL